jgi:hypothetical protein
MKKTVSGFVRRGLVACGFGPMVLAGVYWILQSQGLIQTLTVDEVCLGIVSLAGLAFIAGGMNFLYQIEQLPLMVAILIHGGVLYISYLSTYLLNGWLEGGMIPLIAFTGIFVGGYLVIWAIIYSVTKKNTARLNEALKQKQQLKP